MRAQGRIERKRQMRAGRQRLAASAHRRATVEHQQLSGEYARAGAGQEAQRLCHVLGLGHPAQGNLRHRLRRVQPAALDQALHEFSAHEARCQRGHRPVGPGLRQRAALRDQSRLAGAVETAPRNGAQACTRRHVDDARPGPQVRRTGLHHARRRGQVERKKASRRAVVMARRGLGTAGRQARVVDQCIERRNLVPQALDPRRVRQVGHEAHRWRGVGRPGGFEALQRLRIGVDQNAAPSCARQAQGRGAANARSGAGEQNGGHQVPRTSRNSAYTASCGAALPTGWRTPNSVASSCVSSGRVRSSIQS